MNTALIREMFVTALQGTTEAKNRVFSPRDWATYEDDYPLIIVSTPVEEKKSLGRNAPQFNTYTTVKIVGRVNATSDSGDGSLCAELKAELLREQIEKACINSPHITSNIQQFYSVQSQITTSSEGKTPIGEVLMLFVVEYYQGPECFYEPDTTELSGIDITIDQPPNTQKPIVKIDL